AAILLGRDSRAAGPEAAEALGINPALFRKRLQHARTAIVLFTRTYCGLASDTAACACHRRVPAALRVGRIREEAVDFAGEASAHRERVCMFGGLKRHDGVRGPSNQPTSCLGG